MVTRDDVKQAMIILDEEFGTITPKDKDKLSAKIDIWFDILKIYTKETLKQAVKEVIGTHEYKEVRCAHINLKAKEIEEAEGKAFAKTVLDLNRAGKWNHEIVELIEDEYGELGVNIVKANKQELEYLLKVDRAKFETDLAEIYNKKMWIEKNQKALQSIAQNGYGGLIEQ